MLKKLNLKEQYNHSQEVIIEYLKNGMKQGKQFFKSKYIARDLGMSPKEVGTNMKILSDDCGDTQDREVELFEEHHVASGSHRIKHFLNYFYYQLLLLCFYRLAEAIFLRGCCPGALL